VSAAGNVGSDQGPEITLYWRPRCLFCIRLRRTLNRLGIGRAEVNIWQDPAAAAVVRAHAGGNETVPTIVIGNLALVNPSAAEVVAARDPVAGKQLS
jgi:mycoredoxin